VFGKVADAASEEVTCGAVKG